MYSSFSVHNISTVNVILSTGKNIDCLNGEEYTYNIIKIDVVDKDGNNVVIDIFGEHNKDVQLQVKNR